MKFTPTIRSFIRPFGPAPTMWLLGAGALCAFSFTAFAWRKGSPEQDTAPGAPGRTPHWTPSAKQGVGTSLGPRSNVWFTLFHGLVTEVFFPRADQPAIAQIEFIITARDGFYSQEKYDTRHAIRYKHDGVPLYQITNTCRAGRYQIERTVFSHPVIPVVFERVRFVPLAGKLEDYRVHVIVSPHLGNEGWHNDAWAGDFNGQEMLFAQEDNHCAAIGASVPWKKTSAGYTGVSDGRWQLRRYGELRQTYRQAPHGNVSLAAEVDLTTDGEFTLALGFGGDPCEAGLRVRRALLADQRELEKQFVQPWLDWQAHLREFPAEINPDHELYRTSTMVLRAQEDKAVPGAFVASLTIPWGEERNTNDHFGPVGYHVVWPRDLYMIAGGLLAAGDGEAARRALLYCQATQQTNGGWPQNQTINGRALWTGKQLGETAMPVLLFDLVNRAGLLAASDRRRLWPMIRQAAAHIVREGPAADEDRWENAGGFTSFTLSSMIAALLIAADEADEFGDIGAAALFRDIADAWHDDLDRWTYVRDTPLARDLGVPGYYLRVAPVDREGEPVKYTGKSELWYRPERDRDRPPAEIVSVDALSYVRFGLRAPDDPRILNTVKVIDALLKTDTPYGPCWHRFNHDGYGEQEDGAPFNGKRGVGRLWPFLTGERAHYELMAGRPEEARRLLGAFARFANEGKMLPEQVWDTDDIPQRGLYLGRASGSAMPLAWAHAEYIKLVRSLAEGCVFDMPPQTCGRYIVKQVESPYVLWRPNHRRRTMPEGKTLRIFVEKPATVVFRHGNDAAQQHAETHDTGLGIYYADLPTADLQPDASVRFCLDRHAANWASFHADYSIVVRRATRRVAARD